LFSVRAITELKVTKPNISSGQGTKTQPHNATPQQGRLLSASARTQWAPRKMRERHNNQNGVYFSKERARFSQHVLNHWVPRKDEGA
jgi:hypothetical protein